MSALIEAFRGGVQSPELFTLPNGINEFDICKIGTDYFFAHDTITSTHLRTASSIAGLALDTPYEPIPGGRVPSILFDGTLWHLWVGFGTVAGSNHYTSTSFKGVYTYHDTLPPNMGDVHVRLHSNGKYYAVYDRNALTDRPCGIMVANSPYGPWTNLGHIFELIGRSGTHAGEEDDPALFEADGKTYLTFTSWDNLLPCIQRPAICEINPYNGKAISQITNLVTPSLPWHLRNGKSKLYNPVFLREDAAADRIYFSQNVQATGIPAGWGYIEVGAAPADKRRNENAVNISFISNNVDIASNTPATIHGTAFTNSSGLIVGPSVGGAYGPLNSALSLADFGLLVDFTCASLPAEGVYEQIFRASPAVENGNFFGLWLATISGITRIYSQVGSPGDKPWSTPVVAGVKHRAMLIRRGSIIQPFFDNNYETSQANGVILNGLVEWAVGNRKGNTTLASQQFTGIIHKILLNTDEVKTFEI